MAFPACRLCSYRRSPPRLQSTLPTSPTISRHEYIDKMHFDLAMVALTTTMFLAPMPAPRSYLQGGHEYARCHWLRGAFYKEANTLTRKKVVEVSCDIWNPHLFANDSLSVEVLHTKRASSLRVGAGGDVCGSRLDVERLSAPCHACTPQLRILHFPRHQATPPHTPND